MEKGRFLKMSKVLFVEHCADDFLGGTANMDALTELAYRRICDLIYSTNDNLLDNESLQYATKAGTKWKKIRKELIEVHKKIYIENGFIRQKKCTEKLQKSRANIEQKSTAGKSSAKKRNSLKNNDTPSTAVALAVDTAVITGVPTNQEPNNQKEKKQTKKENYWWAGEVIKLNRRDYDAWFERYPGNDDQFTEWLIGRDRWYREQSPSIQENWFFSTSTALEKFKGAA